MKTKNTNINVWILGGAWAAAMTAAGFITGTLENNGLQFGATLLVSGIFAGLGGWLVLRAFGLAGWRWAALTASGWLIGSLLNTTLTPAALSVGESFGSSAGSGILYLPILVDEMVWALAMGAAQWVALRSVLAGALWWVPVSVIGGLLNGITGRAVCVAACDTLPGWGLGLVEGMAWLAYGLVTGLVLIWLVTRQDANTEPISTPSVQVN